MDKFKKIWEQGKKLLPYAKFVVAAIAAAAAAVDVAVTGGGGFTQIAIAVIGALAVFFTKNSLPEEE